MAASEMSYFIFHKKKERNKEGKKRERDEGQSFVPIYSLFLPGKAKKRPFWGQQGHLQVGLKKNANTHTQNPGCKYSA